MDWSYKIEMNLYDHLREDYKNVRVIDRDVCYSRVFVSLLVTDPASGDNISFLAVLHKASQRYSLYQLVEK